MSFIPVAYPEGCDPDERQAPVRLDTLEPGDSFACWWDNDAGRLPSIVGTVRYKSPGYVSVRIKELRRAEHVDFSAEGREHDFDAPRVSTIEWALGTLVVKLDEEDEMGNLKPAAEKTKKADAAAPKGVKAPTKSKEKKAKTQQDCWCGCGEKTGSRFKPGHDARTFGTLKKVIAGEAKFGSLAEPLQKHLGSVEGAKKVVAAHSFNAVTEK